MPSFCVRPCEAATMAAATTALETKRTRNIGMTRLLRSDSTAKSIPQKEPETVAGDRPRPGFRCRSIRATLSSTEHLEQNSMLHRPGVTQNLARFVVEVGWNDIPEPVRHEAKRALLNFFAVALAGCRTGPVEIALTSLAEFSDRRQATVIGRRERMDALSAAFLNAAGANVFDFCDTHVPTVIHPTAPIAPALFALAQLRRVSGVELLLAFILGVEIECRIGGAISPGHYAKGWHITSTCGVFGAATAAGKLLGLAEGRMISAL